MLVSPGINAHPVGGIIFYTHLPHGNVEVMSDESEPSHLVEVILAEELAPEYDYISTIRADPMGVWFLGSRRIKQ